MTDKLWDSLGALAAKQAGLITRRQAIQAGYTESGWDRLAAARSLPQLERGLYQLQVPQGAQHRDLQAALLGCGERAVVSHRAAARLHRFWGVDGFPVEVTVPRRLLPPLTVTAHRGAVPLTDQCEVAGMPVTTPLRTLLDLSPIVDPVTLAAMLESARRKDKSLVAALRTRVPPDRAWTTLLNDCEQRTRPMDSPFEIQFWHRWPYTGLPSPRPQFEVRDRQGRMFIDFAWPEEKVAVETQGYETRHSQGSFDYDARRSARLHELGWTVIAVTYAMFQDDLFGGVMRSVARALGGRGR